MAETIPTNFTARQIRGKLAQRVQTCLPAGRALALGQTLATGANTGHPLSLKLRTGKETGTKGVISDKMEL